MSDQRAPTILPRTWPTNKLPRDRARRGVVKVPAPLAFAVVWFGVSVVAVGAEPGTKVDFNFQVRPILSDKCFNCHGPDSRQRKAGLRLDTKEGALGENRSGGRAIVPGNVEESDLIARIRADDPSERMPPKSLGRSLSTAEIDVLRRWIEQGADWKPHWAFLPPHAAPIPDVKNASWPRNPIDSFVLARLDAVGLSPAGEASKERLIRRLTFDLTGLPPTLAEIDEYLADPSPDAYSRLVDRLLDSPRFGERMAVDWLDLARYADTYGYQADVYRAMWPWRDWVIQALNANLPYDRFVTWQLAGDLLPQPTRRRCSRRRSTGTTARRTREGVSRKSSASSMSPTAPTRLRLPFWGSRSNARAVTVTSTIRSPKKSIINYLAFSTALMNRGCTRTSQTLFRRRL